MLIKSMPTLVQNANVSPPRFMWGSAVRVSAPRLWEHDHHRDRGQAAPRHAARRRRRQRDRRDHGRGTTDHHDHPGGGPRGPQRLSGPVRRPGVSRGTHHERRDDGQSHDQCGDDDSHVQGTCKCRVLGGSKQKQIDSYVEYIVHGSKNGFCSII